MIPLGFKSILGLIGLNPFGSDWFKSLIRFHSGFVQGIRENKITSLYRYFGRVLLSLGNLL